MVDPPNGHNPEEDETRLDRIERALNLILDDHISFREEHKMLLQSQVLLQGGLEELRGSVSELRGSVAELRGSVVELRGSVVELRGSVAELRVIGRDAADVKALTANVKGIAEDTDRRLRRLEDGRS